MFASKKRDKKPQPIGSQWVAAKYLFGLGESSAIQRDKGEIIILGVALGTTSRRAVNRHWTTGKGASCHNVVIHAITESCFTAKDGRFGQTGTGIKCPPKDSTHPGRNRDTGQGSTTLKAIPLYVPYPIRDIDTGQSCAAAKSGVSYLGKIGGKDNIC